MKSNRFLRPKNKRKRRYRRRLNPVTVCIAAICDQTGGEGAYPKIVFCADRLVSAGIQFESGESKIKELTKYCYAMHSSNDSLKSDSILEKVKEKIKDKKDITKIEDIVGILCQECVNCRKEQIEKDVLNKYNLASEYLKADPNITIKDAIKESRNYEYPLDCEFIIFGLEFPGEAHIYKVDQDGDFRSCDSIGFATAGSGGKLAFLEMTRYISYRGMSMVYAIPKVYLSKKVSERAEGVGRYTDLHILYFAEDPNKKPIPAISNLSHPDFIGKLDNVVEKIQKYEAKELTELSKEIYDMVVQKPKKEIK